MLIVERANFTPPNSCQTKSVPWKISPSNSRHSLMIQIPRKRKSVPGEFFGNTLAVGECCSVDFYGAAYAQSAGAFGKRRAGRKNVVD